MVASPLFEGTLEELYRRRDEFAGIRLAVFAAPVKETENETTLRRPEEVKTPERLVEMIMDGLASPAREMTATDWNELKRRAAERTNGATG